MDSSNQITLNVNGSEHALEVDPQTPLLFVGQRTREMIHSRTPHS